MIKSYDQFNEGKVPQQGRLYRLKQMTLKKYGIDEFRLNDDGSVDVFGDVDLSNQDNLTRIPVTFNYVAGNFTCAGSDIISLKGCPKKVGGTFNCSCNNLKTLEGCPEEIDKSFYCHKNILTNLKYTPKVIKGDLFCHSNQIETLKDGPIEIKGLLNISDNQLTSFIDSDLKTVHRLYCDNNNIQSLQKMPSVFDHMDFKNNNIIDFKGFPEFWEGYINFGENPVSKYLKPFKNDDESCCKAIYWINELDAIQDGEVVDERMEEVLNLVKKR